MRFNVASRFVRSAAAEAAPMQDETIIFHAERNQFTVLNHTAAFVWERLHAPQSTEELAAALVGEYLDVGIELARGDVARTLQELQSLALVEPAPESVP